MRSFPRSRAQIAMVSALVLATGLAACDASDSDEVAELEQQVADLETQLEQAETALAESQDVSADLREQVADLETQLTETTAELGSTQDELGRTQAELLDAQAQLAQVGEVVLEDGTYVGQVLAAKASPSRVLLFDAGGAYRVAPVSEDPTITAGGDEYTLTQFGKLLSSTDPGNAKLANGNYKVIVKQGLVTAIRKSKK